MKKLFTLALATIFSACMGFAQNKTYTMKEAVLGLRQNLAAENIKQTSWIPQENTFTRQTSDSKNPALISVSVPKLTIDTLFSLAELNQQLFSQKPLKQFPSIKWLDNHSVYFKNSDKLYIGNSIKNDWHFKEWASLPKGVENYFVHPGSRQIAYTNGNNLYLIDRYGKTQAITQEDNKWIVSGQIVSRNEFGIDSGVFFSPSGNLIAFYRMDETRVQDYPIINWDTVPAQNRNIKYPMAGRESQEVNLGVYNPITHRTVFMKTGINTDHYLTNVTWSPDEKYIYIGILNRDQNNLKLNQYNAQSGDFIKTILREKNAKYVHPTHPLYFIPGHKNEFIWWSENEGYMHLYRYNTDGKLLNQVTSGNWVVNEINGWLPGKKEIIISTATLSPMDKNIYAVNWETGKMRRLDQAEGMHQATVNSTGSYWLDRYSNYQTPRAIRVAATDGKWQKELLNAPNPLKNYQQPKIKELTITAADGHTPLYARMILPPDFDSTKKYPVVVYLYNGPGVQLLHNQFPESGNLWYDYMAQHGYIIFTMDGRGSTNRGLAFEQVTFRNLGTHEMEDQLKGVDFLKSLPYVDANRLGVHGWSFGGFMTISLMLRHPDVFKCAVAGGPVIDWRMYEVMYTERYMDTPEQNPEGYATSSLLNKVKNLKGKLLVIHGTSDSTVVWQHSLRFIKSCVSNGVQVDYFVYPGHPHNVRGKDRVHLMQKITDYFDEYLK